MKAREPDTRTKVLIVDDHPILRSGLKTLFSRERHFVVCGEAEDVPSGLLAAEKTKPDIVITDISMKGRCGLDLVRDLKRRHPDLPVVVLSVHDESSYAERAIRTGAMGYVMKGNVPDVLITALREALAGRVYVSKQMPSTSNNTLPRNRACGRMESLTNRELEIHSLIGRGFGPNEIATALDLSKKTVETHYAHMKKKLGIPTSRKLLQHAIQWVSTEAFAAGF